MSPTVTPETWRNFPARPGQAGPPGTESQSRKPDIGLLQQLPKGLQRCEPLLSEASLPGGTADAFIFFFLLIFSFSTISTCITLFDKGKELTIKAQEGKRVQCGPLEEDMGTNVPAVLLKS